MNKAQQLINEAKKWNGYLEKQSAVHLDDFTANAGSGNCTIFAVKYCEYFGESIKTYQGQPWCAMFVSSVFADVFGKEKAEKLLGGHYAYCPYGVSHFKQINKWKTYSPKAGDVIFFKNSSGTACHTGIVTRVSSDRVYTIEGNTSSVAGVVANGGCVTEKSYSLSYSRILGYGDVDYDEEDELMSKEYEELKAKITAMDDTLTRLHSVVSDIKTDLSSLNTDIATLKNPFIYNYIDENLPEWARPTIKKMVDKGFLKGDENGMLGLTDELLRVYVTNDRAGVYDRRWDGKNE